MHSSLRLKLFTITLCLSILLNAMYTVPAYADEETPQSEPSVTTEPIEPPTQNEATEAAALTPPAPAPVAESVESILGEVPEGVDVVVLNETDGALPLASKEAAEIIVTGDPIWCPAGVAIPVAGVNGCSGSYSTFAALLGDPIFAAGGPAMDGVIWIEGGYLGGYNGNDVSAVTFDGSNLTQMNDFKLTFKGGWNGAGTNTVNTLTPSVFGVSLNIIDWNNAVTLSDITITGNTSGSSLWVQTTGNITATRVKVNGNSGGGAELDTDETNSIGNITVTASEFSNNTNVGSGLIVVSKGTVTLKDVTANNNGTGASGNGIEINNQMATAKAVTLTNIITSGNKNHGLFVESAGLITATDLTSINNTFGRGAYLSNTFGTGAGVTLNGTNLFFSNGERGLYILSKGAIKLNNINAIDNGNIGADIKNNYGTLKQSITFTGTNVFKFNNLAGLYVDSYGMITANNVTATSNANSVGAFFDNCQFSVSACLGSGNVTLTGNNTFNDNNTSGLHIQTAGAVTISNVTANGNGFGSSGNGVFINNTQGTTFMGVTLTGFNTFNSNKTMGLQILSDGIVTLSNLNANDNEGTYGVYVENTGSTPATPKGVMLSGTNIINGNLGSGIYIGSHGAITVNNLTASFNGLDGGFLDNCQFSGGGCLGSGNITLNGSNNFNGNDNAGLTVLSYGVIKANNLTVSDNVNDDGAALNNNFEKNLVSSTSGVILTGTNVFSGNKFNNLGIYTYGVITLNNVTASNSVSGHGATLDNCHWDTGTNKCLSTAKVTLTGTNAFMDNFTYGFYAFSGGSITASNLSAGLNGGYGAHLENNDVTAPAAVILSGNNTFNNNFGIGLEVDSLGDIKVNNLTASGSTNNYGAYLDNGYTNSIGSVFLTGTNRFVGNNQDNLDVYTGGAITISNLTANGSVNGNGVYLTQTNGATKPITLTGTNVFNANALSGLYVGVFGAITTNNLSAVGNGTSGTGHGVYLSNESAATTMAITMNGVNSFTANDEYGLLVRSKGAIKANAVSVNGNGGGAAFNNGDFVGAAGGVTLTGINSITDNLNDGLGISSKGTITLSNITASNNSGDGVRLDNTASGFAAPKAITVLGYLVANNNTSGASGVEIFSYGAVVTNNVTASGNVSFGLMIDNNELGATTPSNITLNGTNTFNGNNGGGLDLDTLGNILTNNVTSSNSLNGYGVNIISNTAGGTGIVTMKGNNVVTGNGSTNLYIEALGAVTLNNLNASNSAGLGAYINNSFAQAKAVTLTGTNLFSNNTGGNGLDILSNGAISLNNLTVNNNSSGHGAVINNSGATTPANVTITGTNQFNANSINGLNVTSKGNITVNNLTASNNAAQGAALTNSAGASTTSVTLTGVNSFLNNTGEGLLISAKGTVNLTRVIADDNMEGIHVNTDGNINLTCGSTVNNTTYGWYLYTDGLTTVKGVVSVGNTTNTFIKPGSTLVQSPVCPLP
jgi:putative surface-exposed virulence protein